jgi:hypothetical protein
MDMKEAALRAAALRQQLPQWNPEVDWAYGTSKIFGGPGSVNDRGGGKGSVGWEAMQHQLNMKEQEAEAYDEMIRQQGGRPQY